MNYSEERIENPDFLHLRLAGTWSRDTSRRSMSNILQYLEHSGHRLLLLDDSELASSGDITLDYEEGVYMAAQLQGRCTRVAIVVKPADVEMNRFLRDRLPQPGVTAEHIRRCRWGLALAAGAARYLNRLRKSCAGWARRPRRASARSRLPARSCGRVWSGPRPCRRAGTSRDRCRPRSRSAR